MTITWPFDVLTPESITRTKLSSSVRGNPSIRNVAQVISSDIGVWKLDYNSVAVVGAQKVLLWRAIEGMADGAVSQFLVPVYDGHLVPEIYGNTEVVSHSDGTFFNDGSGYISPVFHAALVSGVTIGAIQCTFEFAGGAMPMPGFGFEVGFGEYHEIRRIVSSTVDTVTCEVWPTFRKSYVADDTLNFSTPHLLCRLASDNAMELGPVGSDVNAFPTVSFIEDTSGLL